MSHLRLHKVKRDRSHPLLELYENDPQTLVHDNHIRTHLYVPMS